MGGKSTYLRQAALIPLLAQIGSFVPAKDAKVPIVDRIFARVGASDNIARGQSTFMVEMQETANILHTASSRSLVVLDEIGRGTSTFDGLSIAWAVAEYLATNPKARPKTLFATHYHELTDLADALPGVVNAHVAAREWKDDIVFLRKIVSGRSDRSYGIQVARLAGLPAGVVARAKEILSGLERDELSRGGRPDLVGHSRRSADKPARPVCQPQQTGLAPHRGRGRSQAEGDRRRRDHAAAGAGVAGGTEEAGRQNERNAKFKIQNANEDVECGPRAVLHFAFCILHCSCGCMRQQPPPDPNIITIAARVGPNSLHPLKANDEGTARVGQLMYESLMDTGDDLRAHPRLAERLETPDPLTYVVHLRRGVKFHDGHELTAA